jgi:hypothetical protein
MKGASSPHLRFWNRREGIRDSLMYHVNLTQATLLENSFES